LNARRAVRLLLVALAVPLVLVAFGPPAFTWGNAGVRIQHPWAQPAAAIAAALTLVGAVLGVRRRAAQVIVGAAVAGLVGLAVHQLVWRLEAVQTGLRARSIFGGTSVRWRDIEAVEPRSGAVVVRARSGTQLVIATDRFAPDERVRLERTIARRVRENAP
jgi:hypothetical protein